MKLNEILKEVGRFIFGRGKPKEVIERFIMFRLNEKIMAEYSKDGSTISQEDLIKIITEKAVDRTFQNIIKLIKLHSYDQNYDKLIKSIENMYDITTEVKETISVIKGEIL